ncbi:DUF1707 and DUF4870 domain-containing protein [Nocardiopsis ansamitocini]|uniref:DUF1707 domain-containing protein n=1 Tax=Nocardiopsis ansamitocini TaxID=1670832 RepID=A0A9W6PAC1_9ACTN|nr:DUF1707 and DUF4870 domain-containing protein [Nocardiopsis ansamitocini]GLU49881.1 hypothetical protein Nans01_42320 [Nocardiopsis ansamitocini]
MAVYNPAPPPAPYSGGRGPGPSLRLTHADRDQVAELLRTAYADGRLDEEEFDDRLGKAMTAKVQGDLEPLLVDLAVAPAQAPGMPANSAEPTREERLWAMGGHLSGYFTLAIGPLVVLLAKGGTSHYVRRQAFEAINYQLNFLIACVLLPVLAILVLPIIAFVFMFFGWLVLPLVAGLATALGANWRYPLTYRLIKDPKAPKTARPGACRQ